MAGCKAGDANNMHIVFDSLPRCFFGDLEERPDVDIKSEVGKGSCNDPCTPVVAILTQFGDQDARAAAGGYCKCI